MLLAKWSLTSYPNAGARHRFLCQSSGAVIEPVLLTVVERSTAPCETASDPNMFDKTAPCVKLKAVQQPWKNLFSDMTDTLTVHRASAKRP